MSMVQSGLLLVLIAPFLPAAWIALRHLQQAYANGDTTQHPIAVVVGIDPNAAWFVAAPVDVAAATWEAAAEVNSFARSLWVQIELAVGEAMTVQVNPSALGMALRETMLTAISAAPGGQVLVTAALVGNQVHIRVTDDGPGTDQPGREMSVRAAGVVIAPHGGRIAVEARPGRGTTVTLRLPLPAKVRGEVNGLAELTVLADQDA